MKRKIITTADGSKTIQIAEWKEQYHSTHGAIQEAYHVFIKNGLSLFRHQEVAIMEIGFGTGLNAFITLLEAEKYALNIQYIGVEAFPVNEVELAQLDYSNALNAMKFESHFFKMHQIPWGTPYELSKNFSLLKRNMDFRDISDNERFHLIYFDAFGSRVQPELWTEEIFLIMYRALKVKGVLVTYAAKGAVRRAMQSVGFTVERLPGPPGKREMLRATKEV